MTESTKYYAGFGAQLGAGSHLDITNVPSSEGGTDTQVLDELDITAYSTTAGPNIMTVQWIEGTDTRDILGMFVPQNQAVRYALRVPRRSTITNGHVRLSILAGNCWCNGAVAWSYRGR
jgi:hypothetical protein